MIRPGGAQESEPPHPQSPEGTQEFHDGDLRHYIDTYDIEQAIEDRATIPIYYEVRLAKIRLKEEERPRIDPDFEEVTEAEEAEDKERLKSKWAQIEKLVGAPERIKQVAADLIDHFERRDAALMGKGGGPLRKRRAGAGRGGGCFIVRISDPRIDADYLNAFVSKDEVISWLKSHAAGVIMPNLSNKVLERMPVCFPSREEQTVIAVALKGADDKASAHTRTAHALNSLFRTLLHQLITAPSKRRAS